MPELPEIGTITRQLIKKLIREIPDWPKKGVSFKDITPLLEDAQLLRFIIDQLAKPYKNKKIDKVVGIDARGFLLASAVAYKLAAGLSIVRKAGKLPYKTILQKYVLEYASNTIEMHRDTIKKGERVVIIDDVLATGGTMEAACKMVEALGGKIVGISFLINLKFLNGAKKLKKHRIFSLINY